MNEQIRASGDAGDSGHAAVDRPPTQGAPSIEITAGVGPGFPGWWLRLALGIVCAGAALLSLQVGAGAGVLTVLGFLLVGLAVATTIAPHSIAPTLLILGVMTAHLLGRDGGISVFTGVLAALLLAVHQLSGICAAIPPRSIVHRDALRPALVRFLLCAGAVLIGVLVATLV
ncbi:MAG: hypothetical protein WKF57_08455 [Nakamurella sp.]